MATLTIVLVDGFRVCTCLESQVICSVAPESIIHVLFVTDAETFKALPSLTGCSECTLVSAINTRGLLHRGSRVLSQLTG